jgi:hypothetical protein
MDPQQTPLSYSDMPPGSRLIYEVTSDGIRIERLGWCQGRTIGQILVRLLRMTLLIIGVWLALVAIWFLVLRRIIPGMPLPFALHFLAMREGILEYLVPIASLLALSLLLGNTRVVIGVDCEKLTSTTHYLRFRSREELPRSAIEDIQAKGDVVIITAKKGHRNIRLAHGNNKAQALWLARTLRHALSLPVEA